MRSHPENVEALEHLRRAKAFQDMDAASLARLAELAAVESVAAGDALVTEGEAATDAFVVITGRLEVRVRGEDGAQSIVGELGPGDVVGEMALLTGAPRSATVRARRDSVVVRLDRSRCLEIAGSDPGFMIDLARTLVARLDRSIHHAAPQRRSSVVAILPAGSTGGVIRFADALLEVVRRTHSVAKIGPGGFSAEHRSDAAARDMASFLQRIESSHDLAFLVADGLSDEWTDLCARQADSIVLVGDRAGLAQWSRAERVLEDVNVERVDAQRHLVVLHAGSAPTGTSWMLERRSVDRCHHVRHGNRGHLERLARILTGTSVGLVLGGGGARGFAHFGVLKALEEDGVAIDHVGGSSIGGSIAGVYAAGWDWETMLAKERYATVDQGSLVDLSLPVVALGSGRRLTHGIRKGFGDLDIADLWLDFFCVSTDLSSGRSRIHTRGRVWRAVRASTAIPGVLPPVRDEDGHVLVDGAVLDNLPVDVMRSTFAPASVIAVDVRGSLNLRSADLPDDGIVSGWRVALSRLSPRRRTMELPGIVEVLSAASSVDGSDQAERADRLLTPPVHEFGVLDFAENERIIDAGYRYARDAISAWDTLP